MPETSKTKTYKETMETTITEAALVVNGYKLLNSTALVPLPKMVATPDQTTTSFIYRRYIWANFQPNWLKVVISASLLFIKESKLSMRVNTVMLQVMITIVTVYGLICTIISPPTMLT